MTEDPGKLKFREQRRRALILGDVFRMEGANDIASAMTNTQAGSSASVADVAEAAVAMIEAQAKAARKGAAVANSKKREARSAMWAQALAAVERLAMERPGLSDRRIYQLAGEAAGLTWTAVRDLVKRQKES